jgi:hypothetical protein
MDCKDTSIGRKPLTRAGMQRPLSTAKYDEVRDWVAEVLKDKRGGNPYELDEVDAIANKFEINRIDGQCLSEMTAERCFAMGIPYGAALMLMRGGKKAGSSGMSFEDFEGLLSNTMLNAALLLSFSVTLHTGSKTLQDFTLADERRFRMFNADNKLDQILVQDLTSYRTNRHGCEAVTYFTLVLIIGFSGSIALYCSTARNDPDFLAILSYPFKLLLGTCFALTLLGLNALFNLNWALVDVIYPIYDGKTPISDWFDTASGSIVEGLDVGIEGFTWVTQKVAADAFLKLGICFIALPTIIIAGTYILYVLWTHLIWRSNMQKMIVFMEDLPLRLVRYLIARATCCFYKAAPGPE